MKNFFRLSIFLRGLAMGAADVVPGVSGGTIALLTGIYEELLASIKNIHPRLLTTLRKEGFASFWKEINGAFLLSLALGIGVSIFSFAKGITWALVNHPIYTWAFFFGLVLASAIFVGKQVSSWRLQEFVLLVLGAGFAYFITILAPAQGNDSFLYLFICGAIAICAMILPGISGSLILLLLGAYQIIFGNLGVKTLLPVALGAIVGLLLFSRVLTWLFSNYRNLTLALLTGFILGALNKVWPWKEIVSTYIDSHGEQQPLLEKSILPSRFSELFNEPNYLLPAFIFAIVGFSIVFIIERIAKS